MTQSVCMNLHVINISSFHTLISMLSVKKKPFKTVLQFLTAKLMLLKNAKFQDFVSHGFFFKVRFNIMM